MIALDRMPLMPAELQPVYTKLVGAVGALPTHEEVEFTERDRGLMQYGMYDYNSQEIADDLNTEGYLIGNYLNETFIKLHMPEKAHSPYGVGKRTFPYLTYVGLNEGIVAHPRLSRQRPRLEPVEAIALLAVASKQSINKVETSVSMHRNGRLMGQLAEKLGATTHQGMVGKGFIYGFFISDVKPSKRSGTGKS